MATYTKYKLKSGKEKWLVKGYLGIDDVTGKEVHFTKRGLNSQKEAKSELAKAQYEFDKNIRELNTSNTFEDVYHQWLAYYKTTVSESTLKKVTDYFRLHIIPEIGHIKFDKLNASHCQRLATYLSEIYKEPKQPYRMASNVYKFALTIGLTNAHNPFERVLWPKANKDTKEKKALDRDELGALLRAVQNDRDIFWYTFFYLLAFTGMRKGEACALTWKDVDFKNGTVRINKTIARGENNKEYVSTSSKTDAGNRTILLDNSTLQVLKEWKKVSTGIMNIQQYVFTNAKGSWLGVTKAWPVLNKVCKDNNLPVISPHELRHTHCSMLFEAGYSIKEVQERLGHTDIKTTMNIYTHISEKQQKKSMRKFTDFLNEA